MAKSPGPTDQLPLSPILTVFMASFEGSIHLFSIEKTAPGVGQSGRPEAFADGVHLLTLPSASLFHDFSQQALRKGNSILSARLKMRKLRVREVNSLAKGHTVGLERRGIQLLESLLARTLCRKTFPGVGPPRPPPPSGPPTTSFSLPFGHVLGPRRNRNRNRRA